MSGVMLMAMNAVDTSWIFAASSKAVTGLAAEADPAGPVRELSRVL